MKLQQLKYIVTVAECGTISEAANQLFVSQPTLTNAIKDIEEEMQLTIFHRTNKGIIVSNEGDEFLAYARQVLEQANLLEAKFKHTEKQSPRFSVSSQHYSFAVNAFVDVIREFDGNSYDFTLRETQTYEIIEDVSHLKSEVGILYTSDKNKEVLQKLIKTNGLQFDKLFEARPHVFISSTHPLAENASISMEELEEYPYLSFEQGEYNSFYFSEEVLSTLDRRKNIKVRDRATLFNLLIGLNGYTVSSGVISKELNGENIIARPLEVDEIMEIGVITQKQMPLTAYARRYIEALKIYVTEYNK